VVNLARHDEKGWFGMTDQMEDGAVKHAHEHHKAVLDRLARIEGHIHAVRRMVEEDAPCPEVLIQIAAVRSALNGAGRIILEDHVKSCLIDTVRDGNFENSFEDLKNSLDKFIR
jgi:CsoR family transcriptional regulator, copper-sensing transcriptional repressor